MVGRVFRIIRTPLTLLILVGVLCLGAWWGWKNIVAPPQKTPPPPCVPTKVTDKELKSSQVTVQVFNGGDKKGLAGDVTRDLRAKDFNVLTPTNTDQKVTTTVIVGNAAKNPEVLLVKSFFKGATVKADGRTNHTVDVLVGDKYAGFNDKAKAAYPVKTSTVCLPADSASASPVAKS
ncbi:LytR family transcriptional regulator [Microlunatus elymi]|uniref:LytR family transcriptional regulator n=1 Tax=Microlunatus elymi TaxID=2596828 RepID=A0A516PV32_9ACTN|nr:LytR C-terminal domain-containing protein [Microlunatus elymi]QDP95048.1 LytR family transcriptional regulator [Microlunatus elymi]